MYSSNICIDAFTQSLILANRFSSFLDTYSMSMSPLGCKVKFIAINFLLLWFICPLTIFIIVLSILKRDCPGHYSIDEISTAGLGFEKFLVFFWGTHFLLFISFLFIWLWPIQYSQILINFPFSNGYFSFLILQIYSTCYFSFPAFHY